MPENWNPICTQQRYGGTRCNEYDGCQAFWEGQQIACPQYDGENTITVTLPTNQVGQAFLDTFASRVFGEQNNVAQTTLEALRGMIQSFEESATTRQQQQNIDLAKDVIRKASP